MEPLVTVVNLNQNKRLYMFYSCANGTLTGHWATWTFNHKAKGKLLRFLFFRLWKIKHDSPVSCIVFFFFTLRRGHCISSSWFQVLYTFRETSLVTNYRNDPWKYSLSCIVFNYWGFSWQGSVSSGLGLAIKLVSWTILRWAEKHSGTWTLSVKNSV